MSNKKDEALKLALECVMAWDRGCDRDPYWRDIEAAVTAIKEALAEQPAQQQEPVGWLESPYGEFRANPLHKTAFPSSLLSWKIPLYTTPPPRKSWVGLTADDIKGLCANNSPSTQDVGLCRLVERYLKEKNT